jgi:hypothetical protein
MKYCHMRAPPDGPGRVKSDQYFFLTVPHFAWSNDRPLLSSVAGHFLCYG